MTIKNVYKSHILYDFRGRRILALQNAKHPNNKREIMKKYLYINIDFAIPNYLYYLHKCNVDSVLNLGFVIGLFSSYISVQAVFSFLLFFKFFFLICHILPLCIPGISRQFLYPKWCVRHLF